MLSIHQGRLTAHRSSERRPRRTRLSITGALGLGLVAPAVPAQEADVPRVIVFVADGAGAGHWGLAAHVIGRLAVADFPVAGLMDARGADHVVTESAASASALATGVRTFYGALSVGPDSLPRETALEAAARRGLATGLVTTTSFVDATPAAFVAHSPSRRGVQPLIHGYLAVRPTVVLGGGRRTLARTLPGDSVTIGARLGAVYAVVTSDTALRGLRVDTVTALLGLLADGDLPLAPARNPSLADLTELALQILDRDPDGFFLMVENEETDTQAHLNAPLPVLAAEMVAFDEAIRVGLRYQARRPETLIVVVADHETGGLAVTGKQDTLFLSYHTTDHTAELVPLFARGPGAERFGGLRTNAEVGQLFLAAVRGWSRATTR